MMTFIRNILILFCLTFLGMPSWAQNGNKFTSLEALVGRADVVFTGTIVHIESTQLPAEQYPLFTLTVQVDSALKGTPGKTVALKRQLLDEDLRWKQWAASHTQILWLLGPKLEDTIVAHGPSTGWAIFRLGEAVPAERGYKTPGLPAFSEFLTVLRTPQGAITRVKGFLQANPQKVPSYDMEVSGSFAYQQMQLNGDWNSITVPVVPELELFAKQLIREPEVFFPTTEARTHSDIQSSATFALSERDWLRVAGVKALVHFKSSENIAFLKLLLSDPTLWGRWSGSQGRTLQRFYPVREASYKVLSSWGVKVDKPVLVIP